MFVNNAKVMRGGGVCQSENGGLEAIKAKHNKRHTTIIIDNETFIADR